MEKQAIIYARVSTVAQNTDRQVSDLMEYAAVNGYQVIKTFTEHISGAKKNTERQALTDALQFATANGCTILCSELSRLGRNIDEVLKSVIYCKEQGINVFFQKEQFTIFNEGGEPHPFLMIFISVLGTCASLERDAIRFRMRSGYEAYRANGGKVGRKKGYRMKMEDYNEKYPELIQDLQDKFNGSKGKLYSVRSLAERHNVNPSTIQAITHLMKGGVSC
ncbi:MAG: recombinase family protein [Prevotella sp.]|nr:recombinase family protein [Prevotella sp.]